MLSVSHMDKTMVIGQQTPVAGRTPGWLGRNSGLHSCDTDLEEAGQRGQGCLRTGEQELGRVSWEPQRGSNHSHKDQIGFSVSVLFLTLCSSRLLEITLLSLFVLLGVKAKDLCP